MSATSPPKNRKLKLMTALPSITQEQSDAIAAIRRRAYDDSPEYRAFVDAAVDPSRSGGRVMQECAYSTNPAKGGLTTLPADPPFLAGSAQ